MNKRATRTETLAATTTAASRCGGVAMATTTAGTTPTSAAAVSDLQVFGGEPQVLTSGSFIFINIFYSSDFLGIDYDNTVDIENERDTYIYKQKGSAIIHTYIEEK